VILVDPSKVRRYKNGKSPPKPLHDALFAYLDGLLKRFPLEPDEFLCLNFANRSTKSITCSLNQILKAPGSGTSWSSTRTSACFPSKIQIMVGIGPRQSSSACSLTAA
jgi:hypothetical protein